MADWNPSLYLQYGAERTRPAAELLARIPLDDVATLADLGCGPGNSTHVLRRRYPGAYILGTDSSENMISRARQSYPQESWQVLSAPGGFRRLPRDFDLVFSNACIQWIPRHTTLVPAMMELLKPGGTLAVQVPMNFHEPVHQIIGTVVHSAKWSGLLPSKRIFHTLPPEEYYALLSGISPSFSIWQTIYYHSMDSVEDILDWYRGTGLRPYLEQLPAEKKEEFEKDIRTLLRQKYPMQENGRIIFRFPRFFFTAVK